MMRRVVALCSLPFALLATACPPRPQLVPVPPGGSRISTCRDTVVVVAAGWQPSGVAYRNATELIRLTGVGASREIAARMLISCDQRRSADETTTRLSQIARETKPKSSFVSIGGWPALERLAMAPIARRGRNRRVSDPTESLRATAAIAIDEVVVRVETTFAPDADPQIVEEAVAVGRSVRSPKRTPPASIEDRLRRLREGPQPPLEPGGAGAPGEGATRGTPQGMLVDTGAPVDVMGGLGELEIAVSNDGQNIVVATNAGWSFSNNGGVTFAAGGAGAPAGFPADGDPSLAFAASGDFYYAYIAFPNGGAAAGGVTGCSTGVSTSVNNGVNFNFVANAVLCPQLGAAMCFPDQEHIAADATNPAPGGGDQLYSVWRNFTPLGPLPATCRQIRSGAVVPSIVCSQDSGANWTAPAALANGDFPRVSVGSDGFVYVVYRSGNNLMLDRYSSCATGLVQQSGFPVAVAQVANVVCPVPGLDRCNNGNTLSSHTVAVDDVDPTHVYVAYATNTSTTNEDVLVRDSANSGQTWGNPVRLNSTLAAKRFMPWVCASSGVAWVTWYDRRAATIANNDLSDFYIGSAYLQNGNLTAGRESNLSVNPDPQCASGWPCSVRAQNDSEACSVQPQQAGRCQLPAGGGTNNPCDFSTPGCPAGEICQIGGGCPKYGDYNGNACAGDRVVAAWASATAPPGLAAPGGIGIFSRRTLFDVPNAVTAGTSADLDARRSPYRYTLAPGREPADVVGVAIAGSNDHVYVWYNDNTVSSGRSWDLDSYRTPYGYTLAPGKTPNNIVGIAIAGSNDHVYVWYDDGTVSSGTSSDLDSHRPPYAYALAPGKNPANIVDVGIAGSNDHVYAWYDDGTVSSGTSSDLDSHRAPYAYALPAGRTSNEIVGLGIAGSNDWVYAWFSAGPTQTVSSGTSSDLDHYRTPYAYTLAPNKTATNVVGIAIAGSNDHVYVWYDNGTVSSGSSSDLDSHRAPYVYTLAPGKTPANIVDIGIAGSNDHVYVWYDDGTVSSGSSDDLDKYRAPYAYSLAPGRSIANVVGIAIAGSNDHVYVWYDDYTVSSGSSSDLDSHRTPYAYTLPAGATPDEIIGICIAGSNDHVYAFAADN